MNTTLLPLPTANHFAADYISKMNSGTGLRFTCCYPCEGGGRTYQLHRKQFRNILRDLERHGPTSEKGREELGGLIAKGEQLAREDRRWSGDYRGVCIHISEDKAEVVRLPGVPREVKHLGSDFLYSVASDALAARVKMLALHISFKSPQLFRYDGERAERINEVELPESVYSFSEAGAIELGRHAHVRQSSDGASKNLAQQGFSNTESPRDLNQPVYLREIAHALDEFEETHHLPIVLVGDESLVSEFQKAYHHPGAVFKVTDAESHPDEAEIERVCSAIGRKLQVEAKRKALETVATFDPNSELFSDNLRTVYEAATQNRIQSCVLAAEEVAWRRYETGKGFSPADPQKDDECFEVYDRIYSEATARGCEAIIVPSADVPSEKHVAAILRW